MFVSVFGSIGQYSSIDVVLSFHREYGVTANQANCKIAFIHINPAYLQASHCCTNTLHIHSPDFHKPLQEHCSQVLSVISIPLYLSAWKEALADHPVPAFVRYICQGMQRGFRIGFKHGSTLESVKSNMMSAQQHPSIISDYLHKECQLGRMLGSFPDSARLLPLHIN